MKIVKTCRTQAMQSHACVVFYCWRAGQVIKFPNTNETLTKIQSNQDILDVPVIGTLTLTFWDPKSDPDFLGHKHIGTLTLTFWDPWEL